MKQSAKIMKATGPRSRQVVLAATVAAMAGLITLSAFAPAYAQSRKAGERVEDIPAGYALDYRFGARGFLVSRISDGRKFYFRRGRLTFVDPRYSIVDQIEQIEGPRRVKD